VTYLGSKGLATMPLPLLYDEVYRPGFWDSILKEHLKGVKAEIEVTLKLRQIKEDHKEMVAMKSSHARQGHI